MSRVLLCLATLMVLVVGSAAQAQPPLPPLRVREAVQAACPNEISACGPYADSSTTTPTAICCDPLENVIENNITCLCLLLGNDEVIKALEIDVSKAITLPQRCGLQPFNLSSDCQGVSTSLAPLMSPANAPVSASMTPSEAPSKSTADAPVSGLEGSEASNIAWTESIILGSFLLCATFMLY